MASETKATAERIDNGDFSIARPSATTKSKTPVTTEKIGNAREPARDSSSRNSYSLPPPPRQAQSHLQQPRTSHCNNDAPLRRGKWTPEEEAYALAAIHDFNSGHLDAPPGSTLRCYLSQKLQCDPMRITKKFTGDASIGKKVFHPAVREDPKVLKEVEDSQANLENLYRTWKQRLESQEQEMARKSMAAAAVSVASSMCNNPHLPPFSAASKSCHLLRGTRCMRPPPGKNKMNVQSDKTKNDIAKTASWLDQANSLLSKETESNRIRKEIEEEMEEISRMIAEAPAILAISACLPKILGNVHHNVESAEMHRASIHKLHSCPEIRILCPDTEINLAEQSVSTPTAGRKRSLSHDEGIVDSPNNPMKLLASLSSQAVPVPIDANDYLKSAVARSSVSKTEALPNSGVDAEDAKTFVSFLQSVVHVGEK